MTDEFPKTWAWWAKLADGLSQSETDAAWKELTPIQRFRIENECYYEEITTAMLIEDLEEQFNKGIQLDTKIVFEVVDRCAWVERELAKVKQDLREALAPCVEDKS